MLVQSLSDVHLITPGDPDDLAVVDGQERLSYGELERRIRAVASALAAQGVSAGDRVVITIGNAAAFVVAHLGVLRAGAISVPVAAEAAGEQLAFVTADTSAAFVIGPETLADLVGWGAAASDRQVPAAGPDSTASLMYTTGTSAEPKAVVLSHRNTLEALRNIVTVVRPERERELITLPIHHSFGLGQVYATLATRGTAILWPGLARLGAVVRLLSEERVTSMPGTPSTFRLLLDRGGKRFVEAGQSLRLSVINSAPLPPSMAIELRETFPRVRWMVYYGLTEASRSTFLSVNDAPDRLLASVGQPAPGVSVTVEDDRGRRLPAGERGEIVISGPTVAAGYWRRPEESAASFRAGRLHTQDLGSFDADGFLFLYGRTKDIINVGGQKVAPPDVEAVLSRHPDVLQCGVVGVADRVLGEQVVAAVVPQPGVTLNWDALTAFCGASLQPFEIPRRWVQVDGIPRTETGKVLRGALREMIEARAC